MEVTPENTAAILRFLAAAVDVQGRIIAELLKPTAGSIPDETSRTIHGFLRDLDDAALAVPRDVSALDVLDLLAALFPTHNPEHDPAKR